MFLTIGAEADRLGEHLAARSRADKSEAMRVALAGRLRLCEASLANGTEPHPPGEGGGTRYRIGSRYCSAPEP